MNNFFGGPPGAVILRLAIICFVVGVILSFLGVSPFDILNGLRRLIDRIYYLGFDAFEWVVRYFLLGAVIVLPIWLIARVWAMMTENRKSPAKSQNSKTS